MSWMWCILFLIGAVFTTFMSGGDAAIAAMIEGAKESVNIVISLGGAYMLWMGLLGVAREAGQIDTLSRRLRKPCEWLFPDAKGATGPITLNIAANMLGLGNAATPFGLEAMKIMQDNNKDKKRATKAMCVFLAVNASALQVIPTTMISLRAAAGSKEPTIIFLPSLLSSAIATLITILLCKVLVKKT